MSESNNAKLREAMSAALEQVNKVYDILSRPCVDIEEARQGCREARGVLMPALAAPQRNCERFATVDDARKAHEAICEKYGKCHHGCPLNNEEHYSAFDCFEAWLFATETKERTMEASSNSKSRKAMIIAMIDEAMTCPTVISGVWRP